MYKFQLAAEEKILKKDVGTAQVGDKAGLGALYLTTERIVFIGYERTSITTTVEEEIPLEHVEKIRAEKSLAILPNAIVVDTIRGRRLKFIVNGRDDWIAAIKDQMDKI